MCSCDRKNTWDLIHTGSFSLRFRGQRGFFAVVLIEPGAAGDGGMPHVLIACPVSPSGQEQEGEEGQEDLRFFFRLSAV